MKEDFTFKTRSTKIVIELSDITGYPIDCIVNTANSSLLGGGGVDGAIHRAAGPELYKECKALNGCMTGESKLSKGYNLPARYVIHTVGPVWRGGMNDEKKLLANCYRSSLIIAQHGGFKTLAFPAISTGIYGFPLELAAHIALMTVIDFLRNNKTNLEICYFSCFDQGTLQVYIRIAESIYKL